MATVHAALHAADASSSGSSSPVTASLYVGDLHPSVTEGILYDAFAEFKSLTSVRLCKDASSGRSLCYGYANFLSRQDGILFFHTFDFVWILGYCEEFRWLSSFSYHASLIAHLDW